MMTMTMILLLTLLLPHLPPSQTSMSMPLMMTAPLLLVSVSVVGMFIPWQITSIESCLTWCLISIFISYVYVRLTFGIQSRIYDGDNVWRNMVDMCGMGEKQADGKELKRDKVVAELVSCCGRSGRYMYKRCHHVVTAVSILFV